LGNESVPHNVADEKEQYVHAMFARIARRYDLLNRVLSFRQDVRWRKMAVEMANVEPGDAVLDVATGTGDLAFELSRQVDSSGTVIGVDFVDEMLQIARAKAARRKTLGQCEFRYGNALQLPFDDNMFQAATIGFALRNVSDVTQCLREMTRVVRPGGRVVCLELSKPVWPVFRHIYRLYFHRIVPLIGRALQGVDGPYRYLPESVDRFPDQERLAQMMREIGLQDVMYRNLIGGIAAIHVGTVR